MVNEGEWLKFEVTGSDPDGDELYFGADGLPDGAQLSGSTFAWQPDYDNAGSYEVTFWVLDRDPATGEEYLKDHENITITVINVNRAPVIDPVPPQEVKEGEFFSLQLEATDPDGDALNYVAASLPTGAVFDSATQRFAWRPAYGQAGEYKVTFMVSDNGTPPKVDFEAVAITVLKTKKRPMFTPIGPT